MKKSTRLVFRKTKAILARVILLYKISRINKQGKKLLLLLLLHYRKLITARSVYRIVVVLTAPIQRKLQTRVAMLSRMLLMDKIPNKFNAKTTKKYNTRLNNSIAYHHQQALINNKIKQHTQPNLMSHRYPITPITVKITSDHHCLKAKI